MKIGAIIAARMNSSRLPGKVMMNIMGKPAIQFLIDRVKTSRKLDTIILATSSSSENKVLEIVAKKANVNFMAVDGDENDVLGRYVRVAEKHNIDYAVRLTGDCPFVDGPFLDQIIELLELEGVLPDLITTKGKFPAGIDCEIYSTDLIRKIYLNEKLTDEEKEHMLNFIYRNKFNFKIKQAYPPKNLTPKIDNLFLLDSLNDYQKMCLLLEHEKDEHISPAYLLNKYSNLQAKINVKL